MSTMQFVFDLYYRLFPTKRLCHFEQLCLEGWRSSLSENSRIVLDAQLESSYLVQRQAAGSKVCFYYPLGKEVILFDERDPDLHVATVWLRNKGGSDFQTVRVKIFLQRGKFFSIEFPKTPERYFKQHSMQESQLEVERVDTVVQLTIDK